MSPPSSLRPSSSPKSSLLSEEIPSEDLDPWSGLSVKPLSRRTFQSDETSSFSLELPFKSASEEPHETSPPSSPKTPSFSDSMLLSKGADEVDKHSRSKPPLALKPKFISSEVTCSHHPNKTSPPSLAAPVTRRFPAPSEPPPPPPPEKHSHPQSSPPAIFEDLFDLDGGVSLPFVGLVPLSAPSVTKDDSVQPAQSAPQLGSSDVLQQDETSGPSSPKPEVETKLKGIQRFFYGKNLELLSLS